MVAELLLENTHILLFFYFHFRDYEPYDPRLAPRRMFDIAVARLLRFSKPLSQLIASLSVTCLELAFAMFLQPRNSRILLPLLQLSVILFALSIFGIMNRTKYS